MKTHKVVIIGSGPAGYTAAIYTARAGLEPLLFKGTQPGGQLSMTSDVENYPGFPNGILGPEMMIAFEKQAKRFGTDIRDGYVSSVDFSHLPHRLVIDESEQLQAHAVIISAGASAKWLGIPGEERLSGKGVSACAVCDGFFFRGQTVAVVGGGDSACEEALHLAKLCKKVYVLVRKDHMRASTFMQKRIQQVPHVEILLGYHPTEVLGKESVQAVHIVNSTTKAEKKLAIEGFFVAIGHTPNTAIFEGQINMDTRGYILTINSSSRTHIAGVFAAGDVQDSVYRQAVTAAGSGCMSALDAERYLALKEPT